LPLVAGLQKAEHERADDHVTGHQAEQAQVAEQVREELADAPPEPRFRGRVLDGRRRRQQQRQRLRCRRNRVRRHRCLSVAIRADDTREKTIGTTEHFRGGGDRSEKERIAFLENDGEAARRTKKQRETCARNTPTTTTTTNTRAHRTGDTATRLLKTKSLTACVCVVVVVSSLDKSLASRRQSTVASSPSASAPKAVP